MEVTETYFGGKGAEGTYQTIINQIAPCDAFYSCFLGHCKVIQHLNRPARVVGFDRDAPVIRKWQAVPWMEASQQDAITFLQSFAPPAGERVCLFCDPPYPLETRKSSQRYPYELTTEQHLSLLDALRRIDRQSSQVQILLCTLPNELYENALPGWHRIAYQNATRGGMVTEHLYINCLADGVLQDYRYAGENFTDRQRIKRKADRWVKGLERLPEVERNAILSQIKQQYF